MTNNPKLQKDIKAAIKRLVKRMPRRPTRDPARITGLLKALEDVWRDNADWRLGQLIVNAAKARLSGRQVVCPEIFYLEDGDMLKGIEDLAKKPRKAKT